MVQDYGFRLYNPAVAKFLSVDPLSPEYPELTPYQFSSNRPIDGIDVDGLEYLNANEQWYYVMWGGVATQLTQDTWVHVKVEKGKTVKHIIKNGQWGLISPSHSKHGYSEYEHLQTGTGVGLSVNNYVSSKYMQQISSGAAIGIGMTIAATVAAPIAIKTAGVNVVKNYLFDYTGHVLTGGGLLGSFKKLDHLDNVLLPERRLSFVAGALFDYDIEKGFSALGYGKNRYEVLLELGIGSLADAGGQYAKKLGKQIEGLENKMGELNPLISKLNNKVSALSKNIKNPTVKGKSLIKGLKIELNTFTKESGGLLKKIEAGKIGLGTLNIILNGATQATATESLKQ